MSLHRCVSRPATLRNAYKIGTPSTRGARQSTQPRQNNYRAKHSGWDSTASTIQSRCRKKSQESQWEAIFVDALVTAGVCRGCRHVKPATWGAQTQIQSRRRPCRGGSQWETTRNFSSSTRWKQNIGNTTPVVSTSQPKWRRHTASQDTAKENDSLVVDEDGLLGQDQSPITDDSLVTLVVASTKHRHFPLASRLVYTPAPEAREEPRQVPPPVDEEHRKKLRKFSRRLRRPLGKTDPGKLWERYLALHTPRLRYIHDHQIVWFFRHLSWVEFKSVRAEERYLALLEECLGEGIRLKVGHWNTAISFAGKRARNVTTDEIRRAVETWMRMEEHGMKADHVTFNILFDIAVKARRFALADIIFQELKSRDLPLDRFLRSSIILYAGLRGDGDAVRKAFRDLINAGELVDTAIMNTVILSLIRAGELSAAEGVFGRMKALSQTKFATKAPNDWHERKKLTIRLNKVATYLRREREEHEATFFGSPFSSDERRDEIQQNTPIEPDAWTYGLLIKGHSQISGELPKVHELVDEMRERNLFITNAIYNIIFRGFERHGSQGNTDWNVSMLEGFWDSFLGNAVNGTQLANGSDQISPEMEEGAVHDSHLANIEAFLEDESDYDTEAATQDETQYLNDHGDETEEHTEEASDDHVSMERRAPHFTRSSCSAIIQAFLTCAGHARAIEIWEMIQRQWTDMSPEEHQYLQNLIGHHRRRHLGGNG